MCFTFFCSLLELFLTIFNIKTKSHCSIIDTATNSWPWPPRRPTSFGWCLACSPWAYGWHSWSPQPQSSWSLSEPSESTEAQKRLSTWFGPIWRPAMLCWRRCAPSLSRTGSCCSQRGPLASYIKNHAHRYQVLAKIQMVLVVHFWNFSEIIL